jgi:hypothetical protein
MSAIAELLTLKQRLEVQIDSLRAELETISKTITILERETPSGSPQLVLSENAQAAPLRDLGSESIMSLGLTDRCLALISHEWVAPVTIRDRLLATKYHMTDKGKLLSSTYATLKRLADQQKLESKTIEGKAHYRRPSSTDVTAAA